MKTQIKSGPSAIHLGARLLRAGGLVAFPTETVYGLGGDARRAGALEAIYAAKDRPAGNPLIVHVASLNAARACCREWPAMAEIFAKQFWPGPLTMVLPRAEAISPLVAAGRPTVAVRWPSHPVAQALLKAFDGPIAAPSANRSGFVSPTAAAHVQAELAGRVELIIDGGRCAVGLESTVVDLTGPVPMILRPGAVTAEMLQDALRAAGESAVVQSVQATISSETAASSPGQHARHYAPRTPAYRFGRAAWAQVRAWARPQARMVLLTHDEAIMLAAPHETMLLPVAAADYARKLYEALRAADERSASSILVLWPDSDEGMWAAVRDRLRRATQEWTGN